MQATRTGLTKTEVLVGLICLVVIAALLLPAMQSTGGRGRRRAECASRLGQLVASLMQYEMTHGQYPGYVNAFGRTEAGEVKVGSWAVSLMPYIEQEQLYDIWADPNTTEAWNKNGGSFNMLNAEYFPKVRMFMCSADLNIGDGNAPSSFAVNAGFFPEPMHPKYQSLDAHALALQSSRPANGIFSNQLPGEVNCLYTEGNLQRVLGSRAHLPTSTHDVRDGLTSTIAVTESVNADSWARVGRDRVWESTDVNGVSYYGDDLNAEWSPRVRVGVVWQYRAQPAVAGVPDYQLPKPHDPKYQRLFSPELARPSSHHTGLSNVAMLGGSVQTLSAEVDYRVLQSLLTPHTKASDVPEPDYLLQDRDFD